ncbi:hypothetical protein B0T22DRAFT_149958 [Podospora appendiculata]|uniref:DNA damage-responsive protein 48 n=1 Tax=Podospora appendiculata TaxID=314037 RepID=A0AAE0X957_9PEZI|nr:hypothetical protein B0T22DRAFT_149958 [Podospora appendiculata]
MDYLNKIASQASSANNNNQQQQQQPQQGQQNSQSEDAGGLLGKLGSFTANTNNTNTEQGQQSGSSGGGFMDKLNGLAGGGKDSEKNEDILDKGVDWVQDKFLKQGAQDNESAAEQAKDEQISDFIRDQYKKNTGKEFPVQDKEHKFGL